MANFRTHLTGGALWGAAVAGYGLLSGMLTPMQAGAAAALGTFGGLLPDLDSDTGRPLEIVFQALAVLVPALLFHTVTEVFAPTFEFIICYFAVFYLFIYHVLRTVLARCTVHRGVFHSLPFCAVCAGAVYLAAETSGRTFALFAGAAVGLGGVVHLLLDEMDSIRFFMGAIPFPGESFGKAFRWRTRSLVSTLLIYALLLVVVYRILTQSILNAPLLG